MTKKEFIGNWTEIIKAGLKEFPDEFLEEVACDELSLPSKSLVMGPEIFGSFEITDSDGNPFLQTEDQYKLKYILYSNRYKPSQIRIPTEPANIKDTVRQYEKHLDGFLIGIEKDFKEHFPDSKDLNKISNQIFGAVSLQRY